MLRSKINIISAGLGAFAAIFAMIALAATLLFAPQAKAQVTTLPTNFYAAGASYNGAASPAFAGTLIYAKALANTNTLAFSVVDAVPVNAKTLTVSTDIGVGVAAKLASIGGHAVYAPTSAGISYTGTNTGWSWTTGIAVPFQLKKPGYYVVPDVRILKSSVSGAGYQLIPGVLFGWGQ